MNHVRFGFFALILLSSIGLVVYFFSDSNKETSLEAKYFESKAPHIQDKFVEIEQDYISLFSLNYYSDNKVEDLKQIKLSLIELKREAQNAQN